MSERTTYFDQLTPHESDLAWAGMGFDFKRIDDWHRTGRESLDTASGSLLSAVDALTEPHQVSHLIGYLLHTAVDHLHGLKSLLADAKAQHTFAPYSLIRGSIEAASTTLWILQDDEPRQISNRALTLEYVNLGDRRRAERTVDPEAGWDEDRLRLLQATLGRNNLTLQDVKNAPTVSQIIDTAAVHFALPAAKLTWQVCSAAAHGRTWARQFLTQFEAQDDDGVSKTLRGQLTSNELAIALSLDTACNVVDKALTVRSRYSRNPAHTGAGFSKPTPSLRVVKNRLIVPQY